MAKFLKDSAKRLAHAVLRGQPAPVRRTARNLLNEIRLARYVRRSSRQFQFLESSASLKLHLGCGGDFKRGWINIDLVLSNSAPAMNGAASPETLFINYDLRKGTLPLKDNSCHIIYSSHFFEHLDYQQGVALMRDCYRVLRPGGTFRISLPNFKDFFRAYLRGDHEYFDLVDIKHALPGLEPGTETLVDHVNWGVYQYGEHKCIYDEEKVCLMLRQIGFSVAATASFRADIDPDNELRKRYSFYVEAVK